jgi:hypothetical protein
MNGVEILSVTEHAIMEQGWSWLMFSSLFIGVFGLCLLIGMVIGLTEGDFDTGVIVGMIVGLAAALVLSPLLTLAFGQKEVGTETHYKVTIDDSVSMNEFLDKYEILDQEGKIYTIKERE